MKAWFVKFYGGPECLELRDVERPPVGPTDILIKVEATTVSSGDRRIRALDLPPGMGLLGKVALGFRRPRRAVLGVECTGVVAEVGSAVAEWWQGQAVIAMSGLAMGCHAEYVLITKGGAVVPRPEGMMASAAASLAFGGTTALDFLRRAKVQAGERILVVGASGTVGSAFVQLAKLQGLEVAAVVSTENVELLKNLGATEVFDYKKQNVLALSHSYDVVADCVGAHHFKDVLAILRKGGRYLSIAGGLKDMLARPRQGRRSIAGPASERREDLKLLADLVNSGQFRPLIDSEFLFEDLPGAHLRADSGRKKGSVVVYVNTTVKRK